MSTMDDFTQEQILWNVLCIIGGRVNRQFSLVACDSRQLGLLLHPAITAVGSAVTLHLSLQIPISDRPKCEAARINSARCQGAVVTTSSGRTQG